MKKGIVVAGNIIVDKINEISSYPSVGELTKIKSVSSSVGGLVPNVAIDLKKVCCDIPVYAAGLVGDDFDGKFVKSEMEKFGVDITGVKTANEKTSFTEVMSITGGQRTFFTYAGANAKFGFDDIDWENFSAKMLHLGYFLLLDKVDAGDGVKILKKAKELGVKTSIDLVSENSGRYQGVLPCLEFVDNLIINEVEASGLTGIVATTENLEEVALKLKSYGVKERVIIHMSEVSICLSDKGFTRLPSYDLPKGFIAGTTGAGDAFCAGCLLAIYRGETDEKILELGSLCAVGALSQPDAISGLRSEEQLKELCKNLERKNAC